MAEMAMIEREARAIAENQKGARNWENCSKERQADHLFTARAVIEEMRAPTPAMSDAAVKLYREMPGSPTWDEAYAAMIDAALTPPPTIEAET